jgi:hypothetical protein
MLQSTLTGLLPQSRTDSAFAILISMDRDLTQMAGRQRICQSLTDCIASNEFLIQKDVSQTFGERPSFCQKWFGACALSRTKFGTAPVRVRALSRTQLGLTSQAIRQHPLGDVCLVTNEVRDSAIYGACIVSTSRDSVAFMSCVQKTCTMLQVLIETRRNERKGYL